MICNIKNISYISEVISIPTGQIANRLFNYIKGTISHFVYSLHVPVGVKAVAKWFFCAFYMAKALYKSHKYKNKTWLPFKLVKTAKDEGWLKSLAYFVQLRKVHKKPIFYNYSLRSLSRSLGCSPTTLSAHIEILREKGCIEVTGGNLRLVGTTRLNKIYKSFLVPIKYSRDRSKQFTLLRYVFINRNLHSQAKIIQCKKDIISMYNGKWLEAKELARVRQAEKRLIRKGIDVETSNEMLMLSNAKVGELLWLSKSTGARIQKALNNLKVVKTVKNIIQIGDDKLNRRAFFALELNGSYFLSGLNYLHLRLPNKWSLRQVH